MLLSSDSNLPNFHQAIQVHSTLNRPTTCDVIDVLVSQTHLDGLVPMKLHLALTANVHQDSQVHYTLNRPTTCALTREAKLNLDQTHLSYLVPMKLHLGCQSNFHQDAQVHSNLNRPTIHAIMRYRLPKPNTSKRPGTNDTALNCELQVPPSDSGPPQSDQSAHMCHKALSVPKPNTSKRPGAHDTAFGVEFQLPPSDSGPPQEP